MTRPSGVLFTRVFPIVDVGLLPCVGYVNAYLHNVFYKCFMRSIEVTSLLIFDSTSNIIQAALNYSGGWYNSKVFLLYNLITSFLSVEKPEAGFAILGDGAFVTDPTVTTNKKIIPGRKSNRTVNI